jgi:type IV pilus assembly protein PilY1
MCTLLILLLSFVSLTVLPLSVDAQTMLDYTHYPLSAANDVPPSILILMDNSESMYQQAYEGSFEPHIRYDGYFEPSAAYSYVNDSYFEMNTSGGWNGNFLNWLTMRRIDMVRKVLIGGKAIPHSRTGSGVQYLLGEDSSLTGYAILKQYEEGAGTVYPDQEALGLEPTSPVYLGLDSGFIYVGNSSNPFINPTMQFKIQVRKEEPHEPDAFVDGNIAGLLTRLSTKARLGLALFNNDGEGGTITNPIGNDLNSLITTIEACRMTTWSPLAESLFESIRYFMQIAPYYPHSPPDYGLGNDDDPFFFESFSQTLPCTQSFIILITDGESTHDQNIPVQPPGEATAPLRDYDQDARDPLLPPEEGSDYLDDIALWSHTSDLRQGDQHLEGIQNITLFIIDAFSSGSQLLQDAAKNGGFNDLNGNDRPDSNQEWDSNGDGVPDTYYVAHDVSRLGEKMVQAAVHILNKTASEGGLTIASHPVYDETSLFKAFFKPYRSPGESETHWMGLLTALWIDTFGNIREDTDGDRALVYDRDNIIGFILDEESGETRAEVFPDTDGDGTADHDTPTLVSLEEIHPIWEAGEKLAVRNAGERTIKTFVDRNNDGAVDSGEWIDFIPEHAPLLRPYLRATDDDEAAGIIAYIRGEDVSPFRKRTIDVGGTERVWKLGDIVHSAPTLSKHPLENYHLLYGDGTYEAFYDRWKARQLTVFAGANDGMMHAFNGGTITSGDNPNTPGKEEHGWYDPDHTGTSSETIGHERWAYIPYNLLPHLKWLTEKNYTHVNYVDAKPKVTDARIFTDTAGNPIDSDHPHGWGTVLIGGMGLGGGTIAATDDFGSGRETRSFSSAYFALDITSPATPRLLWEFTHPELGFTTSYPALVRLESRQGIEQPEDDRWFVLFGSGPTDYRGMSTQPARLFVVDLKTGRLAQVFEGDNTNGFMSSPTSIDANLNFNSDVIYIGASHLSQETWQGKIYRLSPLVCTGNDCSEQDSWSYATTPSTWTFSTLFSAPQPITAPASASLDEEQNLWVFFGTGKYYGLYDRLDPHAEHFFFGIKDSCYGNTCTDEVPFNQLYDSSQVFVYRGGTVEGAAATSWNDFVDEVQQREGWYLTFSSGGERVLSKPNLLGGTLSFTTYQPSNDLCSTTGSGNLYTLYYQTGTAWKSPLTLLLREDAYGDSGTAPEGEPDQDDTMKTKLPLQQGMPSSPVIHIGKTITVLSSGSMIETLSLKPPSHVRSGMESWREQ